MHEKLNPAIDQAIAIQEQAGLDEITDGEWRRESYVKVPPSSVPSPPRNHPSHPAESYVKVFAENVAGFTPDLLDNAGNVHSGNGPGNYPAVTSLLERKGTIVAHEVEYSRARTNRRLKCTLPAPYIIGNRMWSRTESKGAYPNREDFMQACVPILREEIQLIKAAGADVIQLDEPWMALLVDADARAMFSSPVKTDADLAYELQLAVDMMNKTLEGIEGIVRTLPAPLPVPAVAPAS